MWNLSNRKYFPLARCRRAPPDAFAPSCLFLLDLQQEVYLPFEFVVHPIRWDRCPLAAADPHASSWLMLQSHRGLALNTLDAYSRALERYLAFLKVAALRPSLRPVAIGTLSRCVARWREQVVQRYGPAVIDSSSIVPCVPDGGRSTSNNPAAQTAFGRAWSLGIISFRGFRTKKTSIRFLPGSPRVDS